MTITSAVEAWLGRLGPDASQSPAGTVALDLAGRLDARPSDAVAVKLSAELRQVLRMLEVMPGGDELDAFLASLSGPAVRDPAD